MMSVLSADMRVGVTAKRRDSVGPKRFGRFHPAEVPESAKPSEPGIRQRGTPVNE